MKKKNLLNSIVLSSSLLFAISCSSNFDSKRVKSEDPAVTALKKISEQNTERAKQNDLIIKALLKSANLSEESKQTLALAQEKNDDLKAAQAVVDIDNDVANDGSTQVEVDQETSVGPSDADIIDDLISEVIASDANQVAPETTSGDVPVETSETDAVESQINDVIASDAIQVATETTSEAKTKDTVVTKAEAEVAESQDSVFELRLEKINNKRFLIYTAAYQQARISLEELNDRNVHRVTLQDLDGRLVKDLRMQFKCYSPSDAEDCKHVSVKTVTKKAGDLDFVDTKLMVRHKDSNVYSLYAGSADNEAKVEKASRGQHP